MKGVPEGFTLYLLLCFGILQNFPLSILQKVILFISYTHLNIFAVMT